ncbi:MAG: NADH-quinone oxidoreductase subunit J [Candidatus Aquicultor sp.]|nr:NADH-quinone oxidoreductase subunit J [Candidatus Aquicultor sp.]
MNDIISHVIFFALAILAVSSAVLVVTGRNLFHAAMFLGLYLLSIAGYYFLLKADLVGMMQVFVYVGGVVVVLLFGIMLTAQLTNVRLTSALEQRWVTIVSLVSLVGLLVFVAKDTVFKVSQLSPVEDTTSFIGKMFMTDYILPFEVISVLLLAALIGAVIIAREEGGK